MGIKITVVGNAGSGKTTLAFQLQKKLNLPLYHLDQFCWKPSWKRVPIQEFYAAHTELCKGDEWIIEGSYIKILKERVSAADVIVFLDIPTSVCLWRVLKRSIVHWGKVIPGNPEGCKQRILSAKFLDFLHWVWSFNARYRQTIVDLLDEASRQGKRVYILKSGRDSDSSLKAVVSDCLQNAHPQDNSVDTRV